MPLPKIIDNERSSLLDLLRGLCVEHKHLSIATGYWDLGAIQDLLPELEKLDKIRLLIGREPLIPRHQLSLPEGDFPEEDFKFDLAHVDPSSPLREAADTVSTWIESGKLEVKLFTKDFLHAKTYVFGNFASNNAVGVIGSSNFTRNGITKNTELNALEEDYKVVLFQPQTELQETGHLSWYEKMWNDERSVPWSQQFGKLIDYSPVGNKFYSPYEMYIKTLHTLFSEELEDVPLHGKDKDFGRTLFDFQLKNTQALQRRLNKYGVAMLSDSVGLGKTTTAINVIRNYLTDPSGKKRVEIICPKSIVQQWEKELASEGFYGQKPITLQNSQEIENKVELDNIAAVSLFVIDESHNLRQSSGKRFQQLLDWVRNNPKAHVLLLTATPINNSLSDLSNQILLGTGGDAGGMMITVTDKKKKTTTQISFYQAIENLKKKINQDLAKDGEIDFESIREVMTPIIRTFVVRRTRQGIEKEYGALSIDGVERSFPKVIPGLIEYTFDKKNVEQIKKLLSPGIDLAHLYKVSPSDLIDKCKDLLHPYKQALKMPVADDGNAEVAESPMFYIFQLILMLGFMPYRWMMYQTKYHGKTRSQIHELKIGTEERKKLLLQLGIFGILRTVFLKRMESSVSALRSSLDNYEKKLLAFEKGINEGKIVSVADLVALESSLGDDDNEVDAADLADFVLDDIDAKNYNLEALKKDIELEKKIIALLDKQLEIIGSDDSKLKEFAKTIDALRKQDPERKVLVFSYFSDTVRFLEQNLAKYCATADPARTGFLTSKNRGDSEGFASRFSPKAKLYELKADDQELDLLVATDVLSEGQNLQDSGVLINYDLHWNPVRMIQRNGRVNRLGSEFDEVHVYNMKPESKLDGYLRLIQRLQGKIDIIRNTIGTDTPVLEEIENPIEYTDALSDIYSKDLQKRMKALDDAEQAADYLLAEDQFVMDLKAFFGNPALSDEYKKEIFSISNGKWGVFPNDEIKRPHVMALTGFLAEDNTIVGHQFVEYHLEKKSVNAVSLLIALDLIRVDITDNSRLGDKSNLDRSVATKNIEKGAEAYADKTVVGAPIGQEKDVLRLLFELGYPEAEINLVRDSFKTTNVLHKRDVDQIKRKLMQQVKAKQPFQAEAKDLIRIAKKVADSKKLDKGPIKTQAKMLLGYIARKLNA
jgi:superfamily II DNA or RNA helicase